MFGFGVVWVHNSGLEMFKLCAAWAYNSLSGHTIPDWKCSSFAPSGPTTPCLGTQFRIGNVQVFVAPGPTTLCLGTQFRIGNVQVLFRLGPQLLVWARNSGLEMFKFCSVWAHNFLSGHSIPDWKCSNFCTVCAHNCVSGHTIPDWKC